LSAAGQDPRRHALGELAGRPAAIFTFLEGVSVRRAQVGHCAAVGRALAGLHLAGRDFKLHRKNALSLAGWRGLAESAGARADNVTPGLTSLIEDELAHLSKTGRTTCRAASSMPTCFPTMFSFSARNCRA
jgi:homoserine kinase type II